MISQLFPSYLTNPNVWITLWPLLFSPILIASVLSFYTPKRRRAYYRMVMVSISTLGIASGFFMGMSREPAVGAIIPTTLTILLGVSVVVKAKSKPYISSVFIYVYVISFLASALWGAQARVSYEQYENSFKYQRNQIRIEHELNLYREELKEQ